MKIYNLHTFTSHYFKQKMKNMLAYGPLIKPFISTIRNIHFLLNKTFQPAKKRPGSFFPQDGRMGSTASHVVMKRARPSPTRWSVRRSWRCVQPSSASSPTWIPKRCWGQRRSAGTGSSWLATRPCGPECSWRTPAFLPRWTQCVQSIAGGVAKAVACAEYECVSRIFFPLSPCLLS